MTVPLKRTAAVLPPAGYHRPERVGVGGLSVAVVGESGEDFGTYDFADVKAPVELTRALVDGFVRASGPGGQWRSRHTVRKAAQVLRRFATEAAAANPKVATIADVSPEVWWGWRRAVNDGGAGWPGQINLARTLLRDVRGLPKLTRQAMKDRAPKPRRSYDAYSRGEFKRIRAAAWRVVDAARSRIEANLEILERHRAGETPAVPALVRTRRGTCTTGELLEDLSRNGKAPCYRGIPGEATRQIRAAVGVAEDRPIKEALFLTATEVYALRILFVCEWGYNGSVLDSLTVSGGRADDRDADEPVYLVELDKPRRGGGARFFSNVFTGERAALWERAVSLTQPARDTLEALGHPTDKLFIAVNQGTPSVHGTGLFRTNGSDDRGCPEGWRRAVEVADDNGVPLRVTLSRLRLTEQALNEKASQNTQAVSESVYRSPDPQTRTKAREVVLKGQVDALEHARVTVQMRTITGSELSAARTDPDGLAQKLGVDPSKVALLVQGRLDTATGACLSYDNSPFAEPGEPCRASFLHCLACPNSVATLRHLPRLVVLHDALVGLSDVVSRQQWQGHYAGHLDRLQDLLRQCATDEEVAQARSSATDADRETVERLLRGGFDR